MRQPKAMSPTGRRQPVGGIARLHARRQRRRSDAQAHPRRGQAARLSAQPDGALAGDETLQHRGAGASPIWKTRSMPRWSTRCPSACAKPGGTSSCSPIRRARRPTRPLEQVLSYQVDAIVLTATTASLELALQCQKSGVPIVQINRESQSAGHFDGARREPARRRTHRRVPPRRRTHALRLCRRVAGIDHRAGARRSLCRHPGRAWRGAGDHGARPLHLRRRRAGGARTARAPPSGRTRSFAPPTTWPSPPSAWPGANSD